MIAGKRVARRHPHAYRRMLSETFLKPAHRFCVQGYDIIRKDRTERNGGGVTVLIRHGLSYSEIDSWSKTHQEHITFEINTSKRKLTISNVYCPPDSAVNEQSLQSLFERRNTVIVGDFNAHHAIFGSSITNARGRILTLGRPGGVDATPPSVFPL